MFFCFFLVKEMAYARMTAVLRIHQNGFDRTLCYAASLVHSFESKAMVLASLREAAAMPPNDPSINRSRRHHKVQSCWTSQELPLVLLPNNSGVSGRTSCVTNDHAPKAILLPSV